MPKAKNPKSGELLDSWGRRNRKHADKKCDNCGKVYRPRRAESIYCGMRCLWDNNGKGQERVKEYWQKNADGYIVGQVWINGKKTFKRKHRWLIEQMLGIELPRNVVVHHKNGIRTDNRIENLEIMGFRRHCALHTTQRHQDGCGPCRKKKKKEGKEAKP